MRRIWWAAPGVRAWRRVRAARVWFAAGVRLVCAAGAIWRSWRIDAESGVALVAGGGLLRQSVAAHWFLAMTPVS
jgi:hypothetical protein